jgi:hypothetical protein
MDSSPQDEESRLSKTKIRSLSVIDLKEACRVRKISQTKKKRLLQKRLIRNESSASKSISLVAVMLIRILVESQGCLAW